MSFSMQQQQQQHREQNFETIRSWFGEMGITEPSAQQRFLSEIDSLLAFCPFKIGKKDLPNNGWCFIFDGMLPYKYKDVVYRASILMIVPSKFPELAPTCHLNIVRSMEINPNNPFIDEKTRICLTEYGTNWDPSKTLRGFVEHISTAFSQCTPFYALESQKIASGELKLGTERSVETMKLRLDAYKTICREVGMASIEAESTKMNLMRTLSELEATKSELLSYNENAPKALEGCSGAVKEMRDKVEKLKSFNDTYASEWEKLPAELVATPYDDLSKQVLELTALVDAVDETIRMLVGFVDNDPDKVLRKVKELSTQKYVAMHTLEKISRLK